ncbi:PEP-CTERM sorting domain-containing protein [Accumulibacter sp.]|uniref:PEP-CTERM sorting domain-containing protein n=1 Tax=Accumulibacter sp. TaxID=2053492 RepID=UPI0026014E19|nr:PEP-CTERM sorting domain-containing protein [Accumulibacter sp.]MCM8612269.1 PEP-CTERM sorting domain-containing protein [Accumulibacter sp.]MCM8635942.1 PEP-CTERM sorting domain-containing protein [Accumulibacter sp.]MCM8639449.1 PEP-CTERM sorting domain-containing protein [Accumulibacter sp.]
MTVSKVKLLSAAVAVGLLPAAAQAAPVNVNFYNDGVSATGVAQFDWAPSNVMAQGGNQAFANWVNSGGACPANSCDFTVYAQGRLRGLANSANGAIATPGLDSAYEVTFVTAFQERITTAVSAGGANVALLSFLPGGTNYFKMYYDTLGGGTVQSNDLAGTGFHDGDKVFDGTVGPQGGFISSFSTTGLVAPIGGANATTPPAWAGQTSVTGAGASSALNLAVTGGQTTPEGDAFFPNFLITSFLLDNISQNLPFTTVDPALQFDDVMNNVVYATPAQIGPVNGGSSFIPGVGLVASGPSIIFQTDPNGPIDGRSLPEPGSLLLLGMGLAALRAGKSRKA